MTEEFRPIKGYENYYISSCGRVLNTKTGRFLKMSDNDGYLRVRLSNYNGTKIFLVHRLVGITFIANPLELDTIDHIDGNRHNNNVDNLQWLSRSDNTKRYHKEQKTEEQRIKQQSSNNARKKPVICVETGIIYESTALAERTLGIKGGKIKKVITGQLSQTHGLHFRYLLEDNDYE